MGSKWSKSFDTKNPETGETSKANVKSDSTGAVSHLIYGTERDTKDEKKHGHVWGLDSENTPENDKKIGGRGQKE
jgi:hypothetical protein